jgi:membrane-bound serine protease (ClpP class)
VAPETGAGAASLIGAHGVVVSGLFPSGQIEIDGRRYSAKVEVGSATPGTIVVVKKVSDFNLVVETTVP